VDFSPLERDGRELGECAEGIVVLINEVLSRDQGDKELGCLQQTQLLEVEVDLECPVLGCGVGVGGEGDGGWGHRNLGGGKGTSENKQCEKWKTHNQKILALFSCSRGLCKASV
jgi:hypothetical protein